MQQRLVELEEKFQRDQEEKEKNAVNNSGDSWKEKYDTERIKGECSSLFTDCNEYLSNL